MAYWPLTGWLVNMLSDPTLGPDIMAGMNRARQAAATCAGGKQTEGLQGWYHGLVFLAAARAGLFTKDTDIALSIYTDGFEAWRQGGFQGWPIIVTVFNLPPGARTRNVCQIVVASSPGPRQPVDLKSFLHPLAEVLNELARGIPGVRVAGTSEPVVLRAHPVQSTTDMSAGEKLLNTTGSGGYSSNRGREFHGVHHAASNHHFFPPVDSTCPHGTVLFAVHCSAKDGRELRP